ncbi:hypothetical protein N1851_003868 [Merluccius polli]|uniref:Integrase core domain-containing protein n=1 Tax=Merluccius polli TaxID=89951 RepID=A0AA47N7W4_MERPO|nr:hypothetical protein N1851_003868 [Merluccius polli]
MASAAEQPTEIGAPFHQSGPLLPGAPGASRRLAAAWCWLLLGILGLAWCLLLLVALSGSGSGSPRLALTGSAEDYRPTGLTTERSLTISSEHDEIMTLLCSLPDYTWHRPIQYTNSPSVPGPNYMWHMDSYDKLTPFGIGINGCIDGFSCHIIWMQAPPKSLQRTSLTQSVRLGVAQR